MYCTGLPRSEKRRAKASTRQQFWSHNSHYVRCKPCSDYALYKSCFLLVATFISLNTDAAAAAAATATVNMQPVWRIERPVHFKPIVWNKRFLTTAPNTPVCISIEHACTHAPCRLWTVSGFHVFVVRIKVPSG